MKACVFLAQEAFKSKCCKEENLQLLSGGGGGGFQACFIYTYILCLLKNNLIIGLFRLKAKSVFLDTG